jgi:hypothetical protein
MKKYEKWIHQIEIYHCVHSGFQMLSRNEQSSSCKTQLKHNNVHSNSIETSWIKSVRLVLCYICIFVEFISDIDNRIMLIVLQ